MGWDKTKSFERVADNDFSETDFIIKDLAREQELSNLGTTDVRRAHGVHFYVDISNFGEAVDAAREDKQKQRKLVRAASVLRKVEKELLEPFNAEPIQLQTTRLHGLIYKPYDSPANRALNAVLVAVTIHSYVEEVFNPAFDDLMKFTPASGLSSGESLIANIGRRGDRELISLGSCANLAAKIIAVPGSISMTEDVFQDLPDELKVLFDKVSTANGTCFVATGATWSKFPDLKKKFGVVFNTETLSRRTQQYRDDLPLDTIGVSDAEVLIDPDLLTETNCKRTDAVCIVADIDGFTRRIQNAESDAKVASLIRVFHAIRCELQTVIETDFDGLVIQHQGDCVLAILHLPPDQEARRLRKGLDIAIALQSSMDLVLNEHFADYDDLSLAVGVDEGPVLVTRLGKKGDREIVCLGRSMRRAEQFQRRSSGQEIRSCGVVIAALSESDVKRRLFHEQKDASYLGTAVTFDRVDELELKEAAKEKRLAAAAESGAVKVSASSDSGPSHVNARSWRSRP